MQYTKSSIQEKGFYPFVLYHGTDSAIWKLPQEKRTAIKKACRIIIEYYVQVLKDKWYELTYVSNKRNREILGNDYLTIYDTFNRGIAMCADRPLFQYDSFYVTNDFFRAKNYAYKAIHFGEIGYTAFIIMTGVERIGLKLPPASDEVQTALNTLLWFDKQEHKPSVFCFDGVSVDKLRNEDGTPPLIPPSADFYITQSFRLLDLDQKNVEFSVEIV